MNNTLRALIYRMHGLDDAAIAEAKRDPKLRDWWDHVIAMKQSRAVAEGTFAYGASGGSFPWLQNLMDKLPQPKVGPPTKPPLTSPMPKGTDPRDAIRLLSVWGMIGALANQYALSKKGII